MTVNLAWPRAAVYGSDHWYYQWGAIVFTAVIVAVGAGLYLRYRKTTGIKAEHAAPDDGLALDPA